MSVQSYRYTVDRLHSQIAELKKKESQELKKQSDATQKANKAADGARQTKSDSILNSKIREMDRQNKLVAQSSQKLALISKNLSTKTKELGIAQEKLSKAEKGQRDKEIKEYENRMSKLEQREKSYQKNITNQALGSVKILDEDEYDVFLSHAFEDKESFVRDLAEGLKNKGIKVWYDEFSIGWGDRQRQAMDHGIASAKFGIVVVSNHFFSKPWALNELEGLMVKDAQGTSPLLPIWHNISKDEVMKHSPMLAGRNALLTALHTVDEICEEVEKLLSPSADNAQS